jgi:hypothetical protein
MDGNTSAALVSACLTAVVTLTAVHLTNRGQERRLSIALDRKQRTKKSALTREKGEELYLLAGGWLDSLASNYLRKSMVMQGKLTWSEYQDLTLQATALVDFNRLCMLINVYFKDLKPPFDAVLAARSVLNAVDIQHHRSYEAGDPDGTRFLIPYVAAQKALEAAGEGFKQRIAEQIHEA